MGMCKSIIAMGAPVSTEKVCQTRNMYLDIVKGVIIVLVVMGHSIQYGNGYVYLDGENFYDNSVFKFIYSFHMPIFMLVSGYLFNNSIEKYAPLHLFMKKMRMLIIPILLFGLLDRRMGILMLHLLRGNVNILDFIREYLSFVFVDYYLWFLWSVFLNSMIIQIVHRYGDRVWLYLIIWGVSLLIPDDTLRGVYSFMYPFFVIGYLTAKHGFICHSMSKELPILTISSFLLFLPCLFFFERESYVYVSGQCICRENGWHFFLLDIYRLLTGLLGSTFVLCLLKLLYDRLFVQKTMSLMIILGKYSMGIYCFQTIILSWLAGYVVPNFNEQGILPVAIMFLTVMGGSMICTYIVRKVKILNYFLLGGR